MMLYDTPHTGFAQKTFIPYFETFGESFVQGRVARVDTERQLVVLEEGKVGGVFCNQVVTYSFNPST